MPTYPAILGQSSYYPDNPPATNRVLTAAILAGSFFFVFAGDWAMPDQDAIHVMVSKYQIQTVEIVPAAKPTLSQAIRASIFEYPWFAVDPATGIVDAGSNPWEEQLGKTGLDKWSPTYPVQVPWSPPGALSPAIQATGFAEVPPSQYPAKTWASNPWKTGLFPDDFTSRYQDNLPHWYFKAQGLPAAILAGSFTEVINPPTLAITKDQPRNVQTIVEVPDYQIRPKTGLSEAVLAGSFSFVDFGNKTLKTWAEDPNRMGWMFEGPDINPSYSTKKGLSEAIQSGFFWQPPYMPLAIKYVKNFVMEQFFPDVQMHWIFEKKKTQPASILAGSFFEVPPVNAAKTWVQDMKNYGWQPELPDITYNTQKTGLGNAIQAGSFFFVDLSDGASAWLEYTMVDEWLPVIVDYYRANPSLTAALLSSLEPAFTTPAMPAWGPPPATPPNAPVGSVLTNVSSGGSEILIAPSLTVNI